MIECDCSADVDEPNRCEIEIWRKARKNHTCCECGDEIVPGVRYHVGSGVTADGAPFRFKTCAPCAAIRERYCPGGWYWGDLAEKIEPCICCDYRKLPDPGHSDEIDAEDAAHVERHRKKTAVANG